MNPSGRLFILSAIGSALAMDASFSQVASADGAAMAGILDGPTRSVAKPAGPGWQVYTDTVPLSAQVSVVEGSKNRDGSCTISASGSVPPGGLAVRSEEIAFNASTCESQIAEYRLSNGEAVAADTAGQTGAGYSTELEVVDSAPSAKVAG